MNYSGIIGAHLALGLIAVLLTCAFILILTGQISLVSLALADDLLYTNFMLLLFPVLVLAFSLIFWGMTLWGSIGRYNSPERILSLLRIDAYSYMLLPLFVLLPMTWEQIGNIAIAWVLLLILTLSIKIPIIMSGLNRKSSKKMPA